MLVVSKYYPEEDNPERKDKRIHGDYSFLMYKVSNEEEISRILTEEYGNGVLEPIEGHRYKWITGETVYIVINE